MSTLAIDPGKSTGWALFRREELSACGLVDPTKGERPPRHEGLDVCVVEVPCHQHSDTPSLTNDLFKTAFRAGQLAESTGCRDIVAVSPHAWKGSVPKDLHNERVLKRLTEDERKILYAACRADGKKVSVSLLNNVIDAVGLGLWYLGRGA